MPDENATVSELQGFLSRLATLTILCVSLDQPQGCVDYQRDGQWVVVDWPVAVSKDLDKATKDACLEPHGTELDFALDGGHDEVPHGPHDGVEAEGRPGLVHPREISGKRLLC